MVNPTHLAILQQGVEVWNNWRRENPEIKPNLRGAKLNSQRLEGANFSRVDIRGANFSKAYLAGSNFTEAKAGLQKRWIAFLLTISWLISGLSGFLSLFLGALISGALDPNGKFFVYGIFSLIITAAFCLITWRKGLITAAVAVASALAVAVTVAVAVLVAGTVGMVEVGDGSEARQAGIGAIAGAFTGVGAGAIAGAVAGTVAGAIAVAFAAAFAVAGTATVVFAVAGTVPETFAVAGTVPETFAVAGTAAVVLLGLYIGWRGIKGDKRDTWIRPIGIAFAATEGTSFRGADLTEANFTGAKLKSTDFRDTILIRSYWKKAEKLDWVRPGITYLKSSKVRQLIITGEGQNQNFNRLDLQGNYTEIYQGEVKMSGDRHIQAGRDYRETHVNDQGTYVEGDYHNNPEQKQNLAQAAVEIQQLLENLSETYPTSTNKEKMVVIGEVVDQIENNPTLKAKVINALKVGGTEAFKEAVNHPLVNILVATIEGWQDA
ncbi:MAG: pentapeptide repeat-containing protein [Xenococcus sp. MO_188.B8]|nr:pentapeptide repeat-containing protein [Xenococcus sp. MO_188.B8]